MIVDVGERGSGKTYRALQWLGNLSTGGVIIVHNRRLARDLYEEFKKLIYNNENYKCYLNKLKIYFNQINKIKLG